MSATNPTEIITPTDPSGEMVEQATYHAKYGNPIFFNVPTWSENTTVTLKNRAVIQNVRVMSSSYSIFVHFYQKSGTPPPSIDIKIRNVSGAVNDLKLSLTNDPNTNWAGYSGLNFYMYSIPQSSEHPTLTARHEAAKAMVSPEAYVDFK